MSRMTKVMKPRSRGHHVERHGVLRHGECLKRGYETQAEAEKFARQIEGMWGRQRAYICWCGYWHLTRQ